MSPELHGAVHADPPTLPVLEHERVPAIDPLPAAETAFVGFAAGGPLDRPVRVSSLDEFSAAFSDPDHPRAGPLVRGGMLGHAVRGFFENGGGACWVIRTPGTPGESDEAAHVGIASGGGMQLLATLDGPLVIVAPDAYGIGPDPAIADRVQAALGRLADASADRIAILAAPMDATTQDVLQWRARLGLDSPAAAVFHPWISPGDGPAGLRRTITPVGHVAGVWARLERRHGVGRAPTASRLAGAASLQGEVARDEQQQLQRNGINVLRAWPEETVHVWGARSLSSDQDFRYVHHRRIVAHLAGSVLRGTAWVGATDGDEDVQRRVRLAVVDFLGRAWRDGLLHGAAAEQAFQVETEVVQDGRRRALVLTLGLAIRHPAELRRVRVAQPLAQ